MGKPGKWVAAHPACLLCSLSSGGRCSDAGEGRLPTCMSASHAAGSCLQPADDIADEVLLGPQPDKQAQPRAGAVEVLAPAGGLVGGPGSDEEEADEEGSAGGGGAALLGLAYGSDEDEEEEEEGPGQAAPQPRADVAVAEQRGAAEAAPAAAAPRQQQPPQLEQPPPQQPASAAPSAALFAKGCEVLYIERDGARSLATVVAVDLTIDPPSYAVRLHTAATVRETEGHRLEPLPPGWHEQQAAAAEPVQQAAGISIAPAQVCSGSVGVM